MNKNIIDTAMLLTPQEHILTGSTTKAKLEGLEDFYRPDGVLRRELSANVARKAREELRTYPLGYMEAVIGAKSVMIELQKIDEKTGGP